MTKEEDGDHKRCTDEWLHEERSPRQRGNSRCRGQSSCTRDTLPVARMRCPCGRCCRRREGLLKGTTTGQKKTGFNKERKGKQTWQLIRLPAVGEFEMIGVRGLPLNMRLVVQQTLKKTFLLSRASFLHSVFWRANRETLIILLQHIAVSSRTHTSFPFHKKQANKQNKDKDSEAPLRRLLQKCLWKKRFILRCTSFPFISTVTL